MGTIPVGEVRGLGVEAEALAGAVDEEVEALLAAGVALEEGIFGIVMKLTSSLMPGIEKQVYQAEGWNSLKRVMLGLVRKRMKIYDGRYARFDRVLKNKDKDGTKSM